MNNKADILDLVMNRWASKFRAAQAIEVLNDKTIMGFGIFELLETEQKTLSESTDKLVSEDVDVLA